ncbi:right-handed parallel beta-helix repeat-containing protein [Luteolibacter sp. SL250]|uniref:right-handed parallel beta-helix repeat-containing protein n=1 Tax=Luteolibacter sp. SL250 TaxID=2995170 RepID=UPI00226DB5BF|nr:right-handed parallel beta-helix repeat-containing protein [Luteolibacter sp. SL250]WAC21548.1 right-handed parallel beta-helix repeat-containing protein [Luteolibacter sp. SL250]
MQNPSCVVLSVLLAGSALAADFHVSPAGSGTKDGGSAANAAPGASASALFNDTLQAGDRLLFSAGDYHGLSLNLAKGGTEEKPKVILGAPGAVFSSNWTIEKPDKGATAITLAPGLSHVVFKDLSVRNYCFVVRANPAKDAPRSGLVFDNLDMQQMRHGFYLSDCDDLVFTGCDMKRYSKHGFRFEQGCDRVKVSKCTADCSEGDAVWETKTEVFTFGFLLNNGGEPNTSFVFEDCLATNNIKSNQTVKYTNGDGFVAEGNSQDVTYTRCRALRNQDGGFDLKVKDVKLTDCIATGHRRDFRLWHNATLKNCFGGWSQTGLWTKGGPVILDNCTFIGHRHASVEIEDKAPGPLTLNNCLLVTGDAKVGAAIGKYDGTGTVVVKTAEEAGISSPNPAWDGQGPAMNSTKHPGKGYRAVR